MYTWYSVLTRPGTLEFAAPLQRVLFTFSTSTPESTITQLAGSLRRADRNAARRFLGNALGDAVLELPVAALADVAAALDRCVILERHDDYQVCELADGRFGFMMVRDERLEWRVIAW
jgi:hypothetical protein